MNSNFLNEIDPTMKKLSDKEKLYAVSDEIQWCVEYFNKNPTEMYKCNTHEILYPNRYVEESFSTKETNDLSELVLENIFVNPRDVCPTSDMENFGIMKDNNVSTFALFQSSEPDYADMKFNSHSDIEHILNESSFTFPSSVLSNIDLENLNFSIFDDESYDTTGNESSKEFNFEDFSLAEKNERAHFQNSFDSSSFTSEETTESDIYFTAFDCLDLLEQFEAVESIESSPVKSEPAKSSNGVAHLCGGVSILKRSADKTFPDILANIRFDHTYSRREDAGHPAKKRKLNIEEYKNRKGLPRSTCDTAVEIKHGPSGKVDEKTAIQKYNQEVNELKMKILIAQPKNKMGGLKSPILPTDLISPKIEALHDIKMPKTELSPILTAKVEIVTPKTEVSQMLIPKIESSPILTPKTETLPPLTPKTETSPKTEPVPQESKPSIIVKTVGTNTDLTARNESHRMFLAKELAQISKMSSIVEKARSKIKSTSLITAMMQNIKDKQKNLLEAREGGGFIEVENSAVRKKRVRSSETVDAVAQTDLTLSKNLLSNVLDDREWYPPNSKMALEVRINMRKASCERRILYVGDLTGDCTKQMLQRRFERFGKILHITLHFKRDGKYYGFIVYDSIQGVSAAIENGNKVAGGPHYYLNFGGRKDFLDDQTYFDFDSHPENRMTNNSRPKTYEEELMEYEFLRGGRIS